jgi:preprotein translocase subunit SecB
VVDQAKEPGIRLSGVAVDRIRFDDVAVGESIPKDLSFDFKIQRKFWESPAALDVTVSLRATPTPSSVSSSFSLELSMTGRFEPTEENPNMPLDTFAKHNGPAQVMPFVREFVANITARSRRGIVLLPSINIFALVAREDEAERAKSAQ